MADCCVLGSLGVLPRPVLLLVLQLLGPADLASVAQVCTEARVLADDPILWKKKCYHAWKASILGVYEGGEGCGLTAKEQHIVRTLEGSRQPEPSHALFDALHAHWGCSQRPWKRLYQLHGLLQVRSPGSHPGSPQQALLTRGGAVPPGPRDREQMVHIDRLAWEAASTGSSEGEDTDTQSLSSVNPGFDTEGSGFSSSDEEEQEDNTLPQDWAQPQLLALGCRYYEQTTRSREGLLCTVTCHKGVWSLGPDWFVTHWQTAHTQGTVALDLWAQWTLQYRLLPGSNGAVGGFYGDQASHHMGCMLDRTVVPVGGTRQRDRAVYTLHEATADPPRTWVHIGPPA